MGKNAKEVIINQSTEYQKRTPRPQCNGVPFLDLKSLLHNVFCFSFYLVAQVRGYRVVNVHGVGHCYRGLVWGEEGRGGKQKGVEVKVAILVNR